MSSLILLLLTFFVWYSNYRYRSLSKSPPYWITLFGNQIKFKINYLPFDSKSSLLTNSVSLPLFAFPLGHGFTVSPISSAIVSLLSVASPISCCESYSFSLRDSSEIVVTSASWFLLDAYTCVIPNQRYFNSQSQSW